MSLLVKICGLSTRETLDAALDAGADMLGFVFFAPSPRHLSLEVARAYQGPVLSFGPVSPAEQYTYSAVWLAFGVVLLLIGIALGSKPARLASAAVLLLTVAKVFFVDMDALTGVWRALSFIGLGLVLVGIGYLYQRLLFPRRAAVAPPS